MIEGATLDAADAYAARETRTSTPSPLTNAAAYALDKIVQVASLGTMMLPRLLDRLMHSAQKSETACGLGT